MKNSSVLPLVSVLMTAYNREKYIGEAIESVLASTYTNFELIITDDGSKDKTVEIARGYAAKDERVKIFINEKNLGDYPNRNHAASLAVGKYLKYVDADDYLYPWGLDILVKCMEDNPEAGWGLCSLVQYKKQPYPILLHPKQIFEYNYFGPGIFHKAPLSSIIKKEVFDAVDGFKPLRMVGDFEMWNRLALDYSVVLICDGVVWYREHEEQESNSASQFNQVYESIKVQYLFDKRCQLDEEQVKKIIHNTKVKLFKRMITLFFKRDFVNARNNYEKFKFYLKK